MIYLYFIRHAQTKWNQQNRLQGQLDSELTEKGIRDAELVAKRFKNKKWATIYSSPSERAIETLKIVAGESAHYAQLDKRLMEIHLGAWQGKTHDEIMQTDAQQYHHYWNEPASYKPKSGEKFIEVKQRLESFLNEIRNKHDSGHILIMTHGVTINIMKMLVKGIPLNQLWESPVTDGASVTIIKMDENTLSLLAEGETNHLDNK